MMMVMMFFFETIRTSAKCVSHKGLTEQSHKLRNCSSENLRDTVYRKRNTSKPTFTHLTTNPRLPYHTKIPMLSIAHKRIPCPEPTFSNSLYRPKKKPCQELSPNFSLPSSVGTLPMLSPSSCCAVRNSTGQAEADEIGIASRTSVPGTQPR